MFTKKILAAAITSRPSANGVADAIDFDGTNDYLSRSSDLVGNADRKTFTFSCWVWVPSQPVASRSIYANTGDRFYVQVTSTNQIAFYGITSTPATILTGTTTSGIVAGTWNHVLISCNMANAGNRSVYVNDIAATVTWTTYTDGNINFARTEHYISQGSGGSKLTARLSHVFLDYQYRDLSVAANRRIFVLP